MRFEERVAMIGPHLSEDQLMEACVLAAENPHLTACRQCHERFDDLARSLGQIREDALREADTVFTPERLNDQHDRILRRLERHEHPAEVVLFPHRATSPVVRRVLGPARRWVASAAVAGLAAGLLLGVVMDRRIGQIDPLPVVQTARVSEPSIALPDSIAHARAADTGDDELFIEIEEALMGMRVSELRAIDDMTTPPEIQAISYPRSR
jgi:hypothetical protein